MHTNHILLLLANVRILIIAFKATITNISQKKGASWIGQAINHSLHAWKVPLHDALQMFHVRHKCNTLFFPIAGATVTTSLIISSMSRIVRFSWCLSWVLSCYHTVGQPLPVLVIFFFAFSLVFTVCVDNMLFTALSSDLKCSFSSFSVIVT